MDLTDSFPHPITIPENIIDVQRTYLSTDFRASTKFYVDIIQGKLNQEKVFVIDENNNKDLSDDPVRPFRSIIWNSEEISEDSTWLRIGTTSGEDLWKGNSEHLVGAFSIDSENYQVRIVSPRSGDFAYPTIIREGMPMQIAPNLALISHNSIKKDTLTERDILKIGEIIKLNDLYYRYESISHFGDSLLLVKENNFDNLVGTQVGMIAPDFQGITVAGDAIDSKMLHDRTLVIVNSCGCGGDKESTEAYFDISDNYGESDVHIIRLDDGIDKSLTGLHLDMNDSLNTDVYHKFRQAYCSRTCYVINMENRIIDKFQVKQWKEYLPDLLSS